MATFVDQIKIEVHAGKGAMGWSHFGAKSMCRTEAPLVAMVVAGEYHPQSR